MAPSGCSGRYGMNNTLTEQLDAEIAARVARDHAWLPHDRRGRYLVFEAGAGRHLRGEPVVIRQIVDAASERRARRFSSLSRARAFAREVGGTVHRWRRTPPGGGRWLRVPSWNRALRTAMNTERFLVVPMKMAMNTERFLVVP
jgi:hypothetical protein